MVGVTQAHLAYAQEHIRRHGPLPYNWRMKPHPRKPGVAMFQPVLGDKLYEHHPLSPFIKDEVDDEVPLLTQRPRLPSLGQIHPPAYDEAAWLWRPEQGFMTAVIAAVMAFNLHAEQKPHTAHPYFEQVFRSEVATNDPAEIPSVMYHCMDRELKPRPEEGLAAKFARRLGFALVVVEFDHEEVQQCFETQLDIAKTKIRWSVGTNHELYPPLYLGHGAGTWFWLEPHDKRQYLQWSSANNSWATLRQDLHTEIGFPFTEDFLIQVCVRLQRLIRLGMPYEARVMDQLVMETAHRLNAGYEDAEFLENWKGQKKDLRESIVSYERLTRMIACSGSRRARQLAASYDMAAALRAANPNTPIISHHDLLSAISPDPSTSGVDPLSARLIIRNRPTPSSNATRPTPKMSAEQLVAKSLITGSKVPSGQGVSFKETQRSAKLADAVEKTINRADEKPDPVNVAQWEAWKQETGVQRAKESVEAAAWAEKKKTFAAPESEKEEDKTSTQQGPVQKKDTMSVDEQYARIQAWGKARYTKPNMEQQTAAKSNAVPVARPVDEAKQTEAVMPVAEKKVWSADEEAAKVRAFAQRYRK